MIQNPYEPPVMAELVEPVRMPEPVKRFRFPWFFGLLTAWGPFAAFFVYAAAVNAPTEDAFFGLRILGIWGGTTTTLLLALRTILVALRG